MKAKMAVAAVLGSFSAILLGAAWFYYHAAQEAEAGLNRLVKERAALDSGIHRAKDEIAAAVHDSAKLQSAVQADPKPKASMFAVTVTPQRGKRDFLAEMESHPNLYPLAMKVYRADLAEKYGPFFRALNLSPDQIDKFETLSARHQETLLNIAHTANEQGAQLDGPAIAGLIQQENDQYLNAQQALLGDTGEQELQQFDRSLPVAGVVKEIATQVALTSYPLTGFQAGQLSQVLANASSSYQNGGTATEATIDWPAALEQAQGILTPPQLAVLQDEYVHIQAMQFMDQFISQERAAR